MIIGIVGLGVVGSANKKGFEDLNHKLVIHDLKMNTKIQDILKSEICFVCVPSPETDNQECDTSIVEEIITQLSDLNFQGIVAIRSTVIPGFTQYAIEKYNNLKICFVPEFLRERCAYDDFVKNHNVLVVGTDDKWIFEKIVYAHGHYPKNTKQLKPSEAEILKYYSNVFAALKVTFANIMYDLSESMNCDYSSIKETFVLTGKADSSYLDANQNLRGYGGVCLPKDTRALHQLLKKKGFNFQLINAIDQDNYKFKTTVFNGMRNGKSNT